MNTSSIFTTPMMQQYAAIKNEYKDCLLLYRLGDFYELFFDDAIIAAKILDITLTRRGKQDSQNIPMCGIPFHAVDLYLPKLVKANYKVAICEQLETPLEAKKRGHKSIVKREVVRIITPGTVIEDNLLDAKISNYLCSIAKFDLDYSIAWIDISTCEFCYSITNLEGLAFDLTRINPSEILISEDIIKIDKIYDILSDYKNIITAHASSFFDHKRASTRLKSFYKISTLDSFELFNKAAISACGSIIEYILLTQKNNLPNLNIPKILQSNSFMILDTTTKKSLELTTNFSCERRGSLMAALDKTVTNLGARMLANNLLSPLIDGELINKRLQKVEFFKTHLELSLKLREALSSIGDIERATSRLLMNKGGPRDLNIIKIGLMSALDIAEIIEYSGLDLPNEIIILTQNLAGHNNLIKELDDAVKDSVGILVRDGNFIRHHYHPRLTELVNIQLNAKEKLNNLKEKYKSQTGISNIKIEQNNVIGYYIEVSPQQSSKINNENFIHRQTLITGIRYTTLELKNLESDLINSKELILRLEFEIFKELIQEIDKNKDRILLTANTIATFDLSISFAILANEMNYVKPIVDSSLEFNVIAARHPVVEIQLKAAQDEFIGNDCNLTNNQNLWLLTGPNMAGKSTFLRQNALIAIMAQIGSYVPADYAHIGIIDRIFSRVGAADDLAHGRSTFMVEMVETASIINHATRKSLLILDEIGRGTATYDGLAIAWSCIEHIHNVIGARTIFATHYHELNQLESVLNNLACYSMAVKEWEDKIIFLHSIVKGSADKSYGIHVAELAGLPQVIIAKAKNILKNLENNKVEYLVTNQELNAIKEKSIIEKSIEELNINNLTPLAALEYLYKIKQMLQ